MGGVTKRDTRSLDYGLNCIEGVIYETIIEGTRGDKRSLD